LPDSAPEADRATPPTPYRARFGYETRSAASTPWSEFAPVIELAYGGHPDPSESREAAAAVFEPERSYEVRRGTELCATTAVYSLDMTLPGGPRPVAGIGYVSVSPAHRRRGLMRGLMRRALNDLYEQQAEPVAALNATESSIYGRFGFGLASRSLKVTVPRSAGALEPVGDPDAWQSSFHAAEECLDHIDSVYTANVAERPGMLRRNRSWLRRSVLDPPAHPGGPSPLKCLLIRHGDDASVCGYALYVVQPHWEDGMSRACVQVREVFAETSAAYAAVWRILLDLDLTANVTAEARPIDDPLLVLLRDFRSAVPTVRDQLFLRLVDVERGLIHREYPSDIELVFDIADDLCPWNAGRWRLVAGRDGAICTRAPRSSPHLALSIRELSGVLLGGGSLDQLCRAGLAEELQPGAAAAATRAFRHDPAPFCPTIF
jgi:predicted acetyltransferase